MKLRDLKEAMVKAYGDWPLEDAFDDDESHGDTLALYIAREVSDCMESSTVVSKENLIDLTASITVAKEDLCRVIKALEKLIPKEPE